MVKFTVLTSNLVWEAHGTCHDGAAIGSVDLLIVPFYYCLFVFIVRTVRNGFLYLIILIHFY